MRKDAISSAKFGGTKEASPSHRAGNAARARKMRMTKRLAAYASMAAAGAAPSAVGDLVIIDIPDASLFDAAFAVDIDGDGINELSLVHGVVGGTSTSGAFSNVSLRVFPGSNPTASVIVDSAGAGPYLLPTAAVLESNSVITPTGNFYDVEGASVFPDLAQYWSSDPSGGGGPIAYGAWAGGAGKKFIGVKFEISGASHLGFVQLTVEDLQGPGGPFATTVHGFGYNDDGIGTATGNALLTANVPEPSTLGVLALGATGVQWLRRRRRPMR